MLAALGVMFTLTTLTGVTPEQRGGRCRGEGVQRAWSEEAAFRGFETWNLHGSEGVFLNAGRAGSACVYLSGARRIDDGLELSVEGAPGSAFALGAAGHGSRGPVVLASGVLPSGGLHSVAVRLPEALFDGLVASVVGACDEPAPSSVKVVQRILLFEPTVECVLFAANPKKAPEGKLWGKFNCSEFNDEECKVDVWARSTDDEDEVEVFMTCKCDGEEEKSSKVVAKTSSAPLSFNGDNMAGLCGRTWILELNGDNEDAHDTWGEGPGACTGIKIFGK